MNAAKDTDTSSTRTPVRHTAAGHGLLRTAAAAITVIIVTSGVQSVARSTLEAHPMAWGPVVLKVHLHRSPAIGPLAVLSEAWALGLIMVSAALWSLLTLRSASLRTVPGGLILGGLLSLLLDAADDGRVLEVIQLPRIGVFSTATVAVLAGLVGLAATRWADADPRTRPIVAEPPLCEAPPRDS